MPRRAYTADELALAHAALTRGEDDLLMDFGTALAGPGAGRDGNLDDLRGRARNWFERHHTDLRQRLCGNPDLQTLTDGATDIAAIADVLAALVNKPAAYTVAAIILKRGLHTLCS
jgi:hypothetical protein